MEAAGVPKQERSAETRRRLLDAAVDELVEHGYARFTTMGVAQRARVSRGAQQHHFPTRTQLVAAAVRHLGERNIAELHALSGESANGRAALADILDAIYRQYTGPLFASMLELTLAARAEPELGEAIAHEEKALSRAIEEWAEQMLTGAEVPDPSERLALALSAIRGIAVLRLLGHPERSASRQWAFMRSRLEALLEGSG